MTPFARKMPILNKPDNLLFCWRKKYLEGEIASWTSFFYEWYSIQRTSRKKRESLLLPKKP